MKTREKSLETINFNLVRGWAVDKRSAVGRRASPWGWLATVAVSADGAIETAGQKLSCEG